jgi:hypothetical protein
MAGHSRSKNDVASLAYARPSTPCLVEPSQDVDARDKRGHDGFGNYENLFLATSAHR